MNEERSIEITLRLARAVLGVSAQADAAAVRRAFRKAAMRLHPDRSGGDAARFREMLEAYRLIQAAALRAARDAEAQVEAEIEDATTAKFAAPSARSQPLYRPLLHIDPSEAMLGGTREAVLADGRRIVIQLPPGLRPGDLVRAGGVTFGVVMRAEGDSVVRGNDLWITATVDAALLKAGGRVALSTPLGRRIVWISKKAGERRLVRVEGQGLPPRGDYPQGNLFVRLAPETVAQESRARTLLRRFVDSWAA